MIQASHEHEFEAAPGLPEPLPSGEKILWQGAPDWYVLSLRVFHVRKIGIYFLCMIGLQWLYLLDGSASATEIAVSLIKSLLTAGLALAALAFVAWLSTRTTVYTITDKRVIMRIGIVLTLTFNLPHRRIASAAILNDKRGSGDIALGLYPTDRIAWLHLWPHARPWHLVRPEPTLRCIASVDHVGMLLMNAWQAANSQVAASSQGVEPACAQSIQCERQPA